MEATPLAGRLRDELQPDPGIDANYSAPIVLSMSRLNDCARARSRLDPEYSGSQCKSRAIDTLDGLPSFALFRETCAVQRR